MARMPRLPPGTISCILPSRPSCPPWWPVPPSRTSSGGSAISDPAGRLVSRILERVVKTEIDQGDGLTDAVGAAVLDYLITGRGVLWASYQPTIEEVPSPDPMTGLMRQVEQITDEMGLVEYVPYMDFLHDPDAKQWAELEWVGRRVNWTEEQAQDFLGEELADRVTGLFREASGGADKPATVDFYEIWHKDGQRVWMTRDEVLRTQDVPVKLNKTWPCAVLYDEQSPTDLVPTPFYAQIETQARELDTLTTRLEMIIKAIRVKGAYNDTVEGLGKILAEGAENTMVPVSAGALQDGGSQMRYGLCP